MGGVGVNHAFEVQAIGPDLVFKVVQGNGIVILSQINIAPVAKVKGIV